MKTSLMM